MGFSRLDLWKNPYREGGLFLGREDWFGLSVGYQTERHAITIGGSRGGKGAAVIIPNLRRWTESAIVIDPKGENAAATAAYRQDKLGIPSYVLDPFKVANVRPDLRASLNVFDLIRTDHPRGYTDVRAVVDGLMMEMSKESFWEEGAKDFMAGGIVDTLTNPRALDKGKNLIGFRSRFRSPERFDQMIEAMLKNPAVSHQAQTAAAAAARMPPNMRGSFIGTLEVQLRWIDDMALTSTLARSSFQLDQLKRGRCTVYLVVPPDLLTIHGRFLRLFVQCALHVMAQQMPDGSDKGTRTLFLLDEFPALGYLDQIETAAGLMPGYGVFLWPFLQNLGQLDSVYGQSGATTFLGNADIHQFFAANDATTLGYISQRLGMEMSEGGREKPVLTLQETLKTIGKGKGDKVARNQLIFLPTGETLKCRLSPWFMPFQLPVLPRALVAAVFLLIILLGWIGTVVGKG